MKLSYLLKTGDIKVSYLQILKELDKSLEKEISSLGETNWFKRHVVIGHLRNALCHIKREIIKGEMK